MKHKQDTNSLEYKNDDALIKNELQNKRGICPIRVKLVASEKKCNCLFYVYAII